MAVRVECKIPSRIGKSSEESCSKRTRANGETSGRILVLPWFRHRKRGYFFERVAFFWRACAFSRRTRTVKRTRRRNSRGKNKRASERSMRRKGSMRDESAIVTEAKRPPRNRRHKFREESRYGYGRSLLETGKRYRKTIHDFPLLEISCRSIVFKRRFCPCPAKNRRTRDERLS